MGRRSRTNALVLVALVVAAVALGGCDEVKARRKIQQANKLYKANKYAEAIRVYQEALELQPDLATGWYNLALAHLALFVAGSTTPQNMAHADGAIQALTRYLELEPQDNANCSEPPCARNFLLSTYIDSGRYPKAIEFFERELAKNPRDTLALANIAKIYSDAGEFDRSYEWYGKLASAETTDEARANAFQQIGVLAFRRLFNRPDVEGADRARIADQGIAALQEAAKLRPNFADTYTYINLLYRQRALAHDVSYARAADVATAQVFMKKAMDLKGVQPPPAAPKPPVPPGAPATPESPSGPR